MAQCHGKLYGGIHGLPGADNVAFYAHNGIPFVVGTTGGDREKLMQDATAGDSYAVIAPQMGKQVWHVPHCRHKFINHPMLP